MKSRTTIINRPISPRRRASPPPPLRAARPARLGPATAPGHRRRPWARLGWRVVGPLLLPRASRPAPPWPPPQCRRPAGPPRQRCWPRAAAAGRPAGGAGRAPRWLDARRRPAGVADRAPSPPLVVLVPRRRPLAQAASRARMTYKGAGVDIDAGAELVRRIRKMTPGIGGFGGHYILGDNCYVEVTGGVGTKLKLAFETSIHDTIGVDLVAMSVNDIVTSGARPLFFQDYYGASLMLTLQRRLSRGLWIGVNNQTVFTWEER
ncbi:hypothetical protein SETIT_1G155700v2 [Setaria italica]|uniref:PurM-like N-terminal domain-containing protein n=1 Tax=Setaria italica TaxID=4555 RepID=A0A368PKR2_SETIT|nr:hypothetical protein SETIT_1G155700v2 [Setaria italica]